MRIDRFGLEGGRELDAQLARLGTKVATEIGVDAVKASATALKEEWQRIAPFDADRDAGRSYGHLRDEIGIQRMGTDKATVVRFAVTVGDAFYADFYELGRVGQPPRPTFGPATEAKRDDLITIQATTLRRGIDTAMMRKG